MDIFSLLDEVQTVARNGLQFTSDPYDRERYERLLELATKTYSEALHVPVKEIRKRFAGELGYITPKVGADAAIFNAEGEILLIDRADGSGWCLPCGWVEPNEKPAEAVAREVREETGLDIEVQQLVGVFTRLPGEGRGPHTKIAVVHLCKIVGGSWELSHEGKDLRHWEIDEVTGWHAGHERYARASRAMWQSKKMIPAISD